MNTTKEETGLNKTFTLRDHQNQETTSFTPGTVGGHKGLKIFGRLDCANANRWIAKGFYVKHRVFFADRSVAEAAGYRPCGCCMKAEYRAWKGAK